MSRAFTKRTVSDRARWATSQARAYAHLGPPPQPLPPVGVIDIDLTPPPDPVSKVARMGIIAQASNYTACRPGAISVYDPSDRSITITPIRCKKWTCKHCGPVLARIWAKRIADRKPQRMITLTCDHTRWPRPDLAYEAMKEALPKLVRRIRDKLGSIEYAAVWELHEDGYPHVHIAQRGVYIPQKWLSLVWNNLGLGPIVDIRKVTTGKAAAVYMAKYMTKTVAKGKDGIQLTRVVQASKAFFEKTVFSVKTYVPPGGRAERCRAQPCQLVAALLGPLNYHLDQKAPGPPWRFVPDLDQAHSRTIDVVLHQLSSM